MAVFARLQVLGGAFLMGCGMAQPATAEDWLVVRASGEAWVRSSAAPQTPIVIGMSIPSSASIGTAANGRVMLVRGQGRIFVAPGSSMTLFDPDATKTQIIQRKGTLELEVEKRSAPYFSVETPLLAALVKGTQFRTTAINGRSSVQVAHGIVQVQELQSGKTVDLAAGQLARSSAGASNGFAVSGAGQMPQVRQEAARASIVSISAALTSLPAQTTPRSAVSTVAPASVASASTAAASTGNRNAEGRNPVELVPTPASASTGLAKGSTTGGGTVGAGPGNVVAPAIATKTPVDTPVTVPAPRHAETSKSPSEKTANQNGSSHGGQTGAHGTASATNQGDGSSKNSASSNSGENSGRRGNSESRESGGGLGHNGKSDAHGTGNTGSNGRNSNSSNGNSGSNSSRNGNSSNNNSSNVNQ